MNSSSSSQLVLISPLSSSSLPPFLLPLSLLPYSLPSPLLFFLLVLILFLFILFFFPFLFPFLHSFPFSSSFSGSPYLDLTSPQSQAQQLAEKDGARLIGVWEWSTGRFAGQLQFLRPLLPLSSSLKHQSGLKGKTAANKDGKRPRKHRSDVYDLANF